MDLETFNPMITERTEWLVKNKNGFFLKVLPLFQQLNRMEFEEILEHFNEEEDMGYFEISHYEDIENLSSNMAPSCVLVFDEEKVFFDILDVDQKDRLISKISSLAGESAKFLNSRPITKEELLKRLEALASLDEDDDESEKLKSIKIRPSLEDYNFTESTHVPKDEYNVLDRSAFSLIAKQPALAWIIENEKNEPNDIIQLGAINWSLDKINEEPSVFLLPSDIEFLEKTEQNRIWKRAKKKAFEEFLSSFCNDEKFWPQNINDRLFDQWFTIKPMGLLIDLTESE